MVNGCGRSQTSKDRAESSFVSGAGVLGAYQLFGSTLVIRIFESILKQQSHAHMYIERIIGD